MSDEKPKPAPARPAVSGGEPPKLERVPAGYHAPQTVRPPPVAAPPVKAPAAPAPPAAPPVRTPQAPGASSYGLAAREVGADAAIAAGLPNQGSLARESGFHLFSLAAAMQASGKLTLTPEGHSFALTFRRGTVEHAASSDPEDDLGRFLVRKGALGADALARAEAAKGAHHGDLVSTLIAERLVNPADVAALLQEHGTVLVLRALAAESGGWSWNPGAAPPPGAFPLGPPYAMLCAAARTLDATTLMRRLGEREDRAAARIGGRIRLEDLRLTPQETRAAGLFDGARSPAEIAAGNPAEALVVLRLAVLLGDVELLSFGVSRKGAPPAPAAAPAAAPAKSAPVPAPAKPPPPVAAKTPPPGAAAAKAPAPGALRPAAPPPAAKAAPAPAAARPPPKPAAPAALDRASLEALVAKLAGADHFAALGVKQDATAAQIKIAYFQLAKAYHPDAVPADAPADVRKLCADVFGKVSAAWGIIGEDAARADYLEKLKSGGTAEVDVLNIFKAENVFQAGELLVKARKYEEALQKFDEAMALNPDEAEFRMWKTWCEFLLAPDKRQRLGTATSSIDAGLKKNPRCAQGYLFLGQMARLAGELALAEKQLKRGLEVAPEHTELQRELKYLRK